MIEKRRIWKFNHPFPVGSNNSHTTTTGYSENKEGDNFQIEWKISKDCRYDLKSNQLY